MLNLTVRSLAHGNAKSFPNLGQVLLRAGQKEPMVEISFELFPITLQNSRRVSRGIGGDAEEKIIVDILFSQAAFDTGELRCQKRADIRAGCEDESRQYDLSPGIGEAERLAVLIDQGKVRHCGLSCLPSDFRLLRWNRQMRKRRTPRKAQ